MYVCIKSTLHTFNSHVSTGTNPCINKAIHMLLMHRFGTLNTLCYLLFVMAADNFFAPIDGLAQEHNNNKNIQTCVDCEMVTNYNVILFVGLVTISLNVCNKHRFR